MAETTQLNFSLTWALQTALLAGLGAASLVLAAILRRATTRVLATHFVLMTLAAVLIWVALSAADLGLVPMVSAVGFAFSLPLSPLLSTVLLLHLARLLADRTQRPWPSAKVIAAVFAVGFVLSLVLWLGGSGGATRLGLIGGTVSVLAAACYLSLAVATFVMRASATRHRAALAFLGAGLAALAARSATNIGVAMIAMIQGTPPGFSLTGTTVQVFLSVLSGILLIAAVLDAERASALRQSEQLRAAEARVATSHRLESLGRMAGAIAHDFNNLLTVISMCATSSDDAAPGQKEEDLAEISATAKRGQLLTQQLLAFARQEPEQVSRFDANVQLEKLQGLLHRVVGKEVGFELSHNGAPAIVEMDGSQFDQVVMNLVGNARDATPPGGIIGVSVSVADEFVTLTVSDTGPGIPAELRAHIFDPFFTTKSAGEGTGLGLATCAGIVQRAGGRIDVSPNQPTGARFDVMIPRVVAESLR